MPLKSPRMGDSYEMAELPARPTKWRRGMKEGPGEPIEELQGDRKAWRVNRAKAGGVSIIWLQKPRWATNANSPRYVEANIAAHERILGAQARVMGVGTIWIRESLHSTTETLVFSEGRLKTIDIPTAAPRILLYAGKDTSRVHWAGWLHCVEKYNSKGNPTGIPLRAESLWNPKIPQGEFWSQGPYDTGPVLEQGVACWEGYVPEVFKGTHLETSLRSYFKPVVATERYTPPPAVLRTRPSQQKRPRPQRRRR